MRHLSAIIAFLMPACMGLPGAGALASAAATREFSYYKVILDKKPFGEVAPAEAAPAQAALGDMIAKDLEMKAIVDDGTGMRVGLLDKKNNKNFFIGLGESHDGLQLVSVNYENEEAVLKKGAETAVIKLHPDKDKAASSAPAPNALAQMAAAQPLSFTNASLARRPFFGDLSKRRASPFKPVGTNTLPFQARPLDSFFKITTGTFPQAQSSPFGPFQPPPAGAGPSPIQTFMPPASNVPNPFVPMSQPNPNAPVPAGGATFEQLFRTQPAAQTPVQFPAEGGEIVEEIAQ